MGDDGGQQVQTLVRAAFAADRRAVQLSRRRVKLDFDAHGPAAGVVGGVGARMRDGGEVGNALPLQLPLRQAGAADGEVEHLGNGRADGAAVFVGVALREVVGAKPRLLVGRARQETELALARQRVDRLHGIAHGVDVGVGGLHVAVDPDAAQRADLQTGIDGQCRERFHADTHQHEVGG